jgi:hypothetical protein
MGFEGRPEDPLVLGKRIAVPRPKLLQEPRRAFDVGEQERDGAARQLGHRQARVPHFTRKRKRDSVERQWAVQGSNLRPWD